MEFFVQGALGPTAFLPLRLRVLLREENQTILTVKRNQRPLRYLQRKERNIIANPQSLSRMHPSPVVPDVADRFRADAKLFRDRRALPLQPRLDRF